MELDFKNMQKGAVYRNNEETTQQLDEENLFNIINKRLINIIMNKNKENGIAFYKLIEEQNISETFVCQFLKCVMLSKFESVKIY